MVRSGMGSFGSGSNGRGMASARAARRIPSSRARSPGDPGLGHRGAAGAQPRTTDGRTPRATSTPSACRRLRHAHTHAGPQSPASAEDAGAKDLHVLGGPVCSIRLDVAQSLHDVHAVADASKYGVLPVQVRLRRQRDEELCTARRGSRVQPRSVAAFLPGAR